MRMPLFTVLVVVGGCAKPERMQEQVAANYELTASVDLSAVSVNGQQGTVDGDLVVREVGDKDIELAGTITGLAPGTWTLHLHLPRACFPTQQPHVAADHHADLGTLTADANGTATLKVTTPGRLGGMSPTSSYCVIVMPPDGSEFIAYGKILGKALGTGH